MTALHVGFDAQILRRQRLGGITRYFADLTAQLLSAGLRVSAEDPSRLFWSQPRAWRQADVVHATFYSGSPYRMRKHQRLISSLFDMTPERYPEHFFLSGLRSPLANKQVWLSASDKIISISAASADDLYFSRPELSAPVDIIHLATSIHLIQPEPFSPLLHRRFWLMIGKRHAYKNGAVLLRALAALRSGGTCSASMPLLVFVGGGPWRPAEQRWIADHRLEHAVLQVNAEDAQLAWLYRNAEAVLVPSLAEGFSLPLIEALSCDTAVVASDIEVHREVGGDYATFLSPVNTQAWADWFMSHSTAPPLHPSVRLGVTRHATLCEHYALDRMTTEHIQAYQSLF
jgi:glycosyltransferase involved in cell wall biosynthesis